MPVAAVQPQGPEWARPCLLPQPLGKPGSDRSSLCPSEGRLDFGHRSQAAAVVPASLGMHQHQPVCTFHTW